MMLASVQLPCLSEPTPLWVQAVAATSACCAMLDTWLTIHKRWQAWSFKIANVGMYSIVNYHFRLWGYLGLSLIMVPLYIQGFIRWRRERLKAKPYTIQV